MPPPAQYQAVPVDVGDVVASTLQTLKGVSLALGVSRTLYFGVVVVLMLTEAYTSATCSNCRC